MTGARVGVVGDADLAAAVTAAGGEPVDEGFKEAALVVVAGESALVDVARAGVDAPVLPVAAGAGVRSVARADVESAVARLLEGEYGTLRHPVVWADGPAAGTAALFDVALMAAEPARISEFAVHRGDDRVARFRADGVVASTPAGSAGYNRAAGGPVVAPETDAVAVVPVAPFTTHADRWVLPAGEVALSVERDETPVELLADGRTEATVAAGEPVSLSPLADLGTVVVPESEPFF
jgi:NAD+ kinase